MLDYTCISKGDAFTWYRQEVLSLKYSLASENTGGVKGTGRPGWAGDGAGGIAVACPCLVLTAPSRGRLTVAMNF